MLYLNDKKVDIKKFPNGESLINVNVLEVTKDINKLKMKFENDSDITNLIFLKNHLDELNVDVELILPYMPYSRMDRTEGMTVFTLKYFCKIINGLHFSKVWIYEPHSDVCVALLDRVTVINMTKELSMIALKELQKENENIYIVYPDAGAAKRYEKQIKYKKVLTANKERDFETGYIKKLEINGEVEEEAFDAIIVDDLCSRGGTFILTAEKLKELGARNIYLVVTHCENTIKEGDILKNELIKKVYTTDSILTECHEKIILKSI